MGKILSKVAHARHPFRNAAIGLGVVALAAVSGGSYYWWTVAHAKPQYVTAEVTQGDIERSVNVTGSINPRVTVQVGSYVSGTVKSLSCDFNSQVKAGQICAKIDPSTFQVVVDQTAAQLNSSRAQLHKDEAALTYAKAVFDRDTKLLTDGIVAQEIVDNDKSVYKQALAQIDLDKATIVAQQASLKSAVVNLGYTNIVSPVTGTVLTRNVDVGQTVASSLQTPTLFLIGKDMTKMQVDANVSEADVGRIKVDQDVIFSVQAYPDKEFSGKVRQIRRGPITVQNVVTYDVVVSVDNPELLLFPGMTADAEIVTDAQENVLRVPLAAVRFTPEHGGHGGDTATHGTAVHRENRGEKQGEDQGENHAKATAIARTENHDDKAGDSSSNSGSDKSAHKSGDSSAVASAPNESQGSDQEQRRSGNHRGVNGEHRDWTRGEHRDWTHGEQRGEHRGEHTDIQAEHHDDSGNSASKTEEVGTPPAAAKSEAQPRKRSRVWVLRDGVPRPIWITTGLDDGELVQVLRGDLKPGDKVIVGEVHPVEAKSASIQSPFNQAAGRRGMGRP